MLQAFNDRLKATTEKNRIEIETMMQSELKVLGQTLRNTALEELKKTEDAIRDRASYLNRRERWIWISAIVCAAILLISLLLAYSLNLYLGRTIAARSSQVEALNQTLDQLQNLQGASFFETQEGTFLILPTPTHSCNNNPCLKIGE